MTPRFDMVGIVSEDIARSVAFYRLLGVEVPTGSEGEAHVEGVLPGGPRIGWDGPAVIASFDPGFDLPAPGSGRLGLAFRCADPAEVDQLYAAVTAAGFEGHLPPWDAFWGMRYATVRDPDGNGVDLFADLPSSPGAGSGSDF